MHETIIKLKQRLAALTPEASPQGLFMLGDPGVDGWLGGGLARGVLHEVFAAETTDMAAASSVAAAFAGRAAPRERKIAWVRQNFADSEAGALHAPGLAELGLDPDALFLVRVRDAVAVLRAGHETARCAALGAVIIEIWKTPKALDFTASRRLSLAAAKSGVTTFLLRASAEPRPSAALTRWRVASGVSQSLAADAPGHPAFDITLLRHRAGISGRNWRLEWDRDRHLFRETAPLSGAVVSLPADRPSGEAQLEYAKAG